MMILRMKKRMPLRPLEKVMIEQFYLSYPVFKEFVKV